MSLLQIALILISENEIAEENKETEDNEKEEENEKEEDKEGEKKDDDMRAENGESIYSIQILLLLSLV